MVVVEVEKTSVTATKATHPVHDQCTTKPKSKRKKKSIQASETYMQKFDDEKVSNSATK